MTRAVLEGVAFGLKDSFTLIANAGLPVKYQVQISGGGAKSPIWQQIIADILNTPLVNVSTTEAGALGAAVLAMVGAGAYPSVEAACEATIQTGSTVEPGHDTVVYPAYYSIYQTLYGSLQQPFNEIARLNSV